METLLERLGRSALECREPDRPNTVFLHSLPLAPSFVLRDARALGEQLKALGSQFWTPVGLRTLSPRAEFSRSDRAPPRSSR